MNDNLFRSSSMEFFDSSFTTHNLLGGTILNIRSIHTLKRKKYYWIIAALQYCVIFCRASKWISHMYTCVCAPSCFTCVFLRPYGLYTSRLLCPWDSPGEDTEVGCHAHRQGIFPIQESNPHLLPLLYYKWILYCWTTREAHVYIYPLFIGFPALWRTVWRFLKRLKVKLLCDPAIPLLAYTERKP